MDTSRVDGVSTRRDAEVARSSFAHPPSSSACRMSSAVGGRSLFNKSLATSALARRATKDAASACSTAFLSCSFCASWAAIVAALVSTPRGDDGVELLRAASFYASRRRRRRAFLCRPRSGEAASVTNIAAARRAFLFASVLQYASPSCCQLIKHLRRDCGAICESLARIQTSKLLQTLFKQKPCRSCRLRSKTTLTARCR